MTNGLLGIEGICKNFGGLDVLIDVSFDVPEGKIYGLIGPNGAGKTTLLNVISGVLWPTRGKVSLAGKSVECQSPHRIAEEGIARTYQTIKLFNSMTVLENVLVGYHHHMKAGFAQALFRTALYRREDREARETAEALLKRFGIDHLSDRLVSKLSYGDQRRVEIARALAMRPRVLLLDEPTAGMTMAESERLGELLLELREGGLTILVVEHNMRLIMGFSDHVFAINFGKKLVEGTPAEVQRSPELIAAYLGGEYSA